MIFINWGNVNICDIPDTEYERIYSLLSPSRKARVDALMHSEDKMCTLAGEFLARKILKEKYGAESVEITVSDNGKPILNCPLCLSISHSHGTVACAVDTAPVGIDVEKIRPVKSKLIDRVCTDDELQYVLNGKNPDTLCKNSEVLKRFFEIWCSKEAYYKKLGGDIKSFKDVNTLTLQKQIIEKQGFIICII